MGEVLVNLTACGRKGCKTLEGIAVDAGSTHTMLTEETAHELGIDPAFLREAETAGGIIKLYEGSATITLDGRTGLLPVFIHNKTVIGRTTLESLGFKIDPVARRLEARPLTA